MGTRRVHGAQSCQGQSLIELIIGIAIAAIIAGSVVGALLLSVRINKQSITTKDASSLTQELLDNARSVAEGDWSELYGQTNKTPSSTYYIIGTSTLSVATGTETVFAGTATYTRWFSVENVNRDASGNIVTSGGNEDPSTQKITGYAQWPFFGSTAEAKVVEYFTRWIRNEVTAFTDWGGSPGVEGPVAEPDANYSTATGVDVTVRGEITLQ